MGAPFIAGDRIELISMPEDEPKPIPVGTKGTVWPNIEQVPAGEGPCVWVVPVRWDNGWFVPLVLPTDRAKLVGHVSMKEAEA